MEIYPTSFLPLLRHISEAISLKKSATNYDNLLHKILEEKFPPYDEALVAHAEVRSAEVLGRRHDKIMLLSKLINSDKKGVQLSVIPILGSSGIGKTALARLVYEEEPVKERFELRVWVRVEEREFDLKHAAREILKSAMGMPCSFDELDELDEMVRDSLQSQRCLIVFDGIKFMSKDSWLHMNQYWFDLLDLGSKVLITTPSKDVADLVTEQSFELEQLIPYYGLSLFNVIAFNTSEVINDVMSPMAQNLAYGCGGIPLLLKLFGSLIRYDHKMKDLFTHDILLSSSWDASATILLSLWGLSPQLRRCLAYCTLFPKGYALSREKIVDMWIADGLVKSSPDNSSLVDIGNAYFYQLHCRSFFTDITCDQCDNIIEFRIPSLIHEMAEDVARTIYKEKIGLIGFVGEDAAQLSLTGENKPEHIRTLILSSTIYFGGSVDDHSLLDFQELRSLDLSCSGIRNLSGDISVLRELRYLNLSYTLIERLPDSIADLSLLQTLDLSWCYHLKVLPKKLRSLTLMSHLDLSRCESLTYFPSGIGFLASLSSMPLFVLGKDHGCARLRELGLLNLLRGRLEIRNLENVRETTEAQDAKLDQKRLVHLELSWSQNADDCFEVLELLQPNQLLKVLHLTGYMGSGFPLWISSIKSLVKIFITDCGCEKLPSLGPLPFLKELQLKGLMNLECIGREFYGDGIVDEVFFQSLEQLELHELPRLLEWSGVTPHASFRTLKSLTIEGCPRLCSLPPLPTMRDLIVSSSNRSIFSSLTRFASSLLINDMELVALLLINVMESKALRYLATFGALKKLILRNVQNMGIDSILQNGEQIMFTALEHVGIFNCNELRHLDLHKFSSLKKLHIVDCQDFLGILMGKENRNLLEIKEKDAPSQKKEKEKDIGLLMELVLEDCPQAIAYFSFHELPSLRKLIVRNCSRQFSLYYNGAYKRLEKLQYLSIRGCPRIESELRSYPWLISHIPCIIVGDHKADYNDMKDLRKLVSDERGYSTDQPPKDLRKELIKASYEWIFEQDSVRIPAHHFPYTALIAATKNFHHSHKLGEEELGPVFKGKLNDGREIALKKVSQSAQSKQEFLQAAELLSCLQHKNLVNLLGYCVHDAEKLLVYEYVANQSLNKLLFETEGRKLLDWERRRGIIQGVADGLLYLHESANVRIIHTNIKASNILLDENWVPKIADLGMAPRIRDDQTNLTESGHMAREYFRRGRVSEKTDVFSFGVVLLELIAGKENSNSDRGRDVSKLLEWAYKLYKEGRSLEIVDPILVASAAPQQIAKLIQIGLLCVQSAPLRPHMQRVALLLSRNGDPSHLEELSPCEPSSQTSRHTYLYDYTDWR